VSPDFLAAIDARLAAATPGPWALRRYERAAYNGSEARDGWQVEGPTYVPDYEVTFFCEADADLIAHAPEDLRRLRKAYDKALRERNEAEAQADLGLRLAELRVPLERHETVVLERDEARARELKALRERDEALAKVERLQEQVDRYRESLDLALGPDSPLPRLIKEVIRGFFLGC